MRFSVCSWLSPGLFLSCSSPSLFRPRESGNAESFQFFRAEASEASADRLLQSDLVKLISFCSIDMHYLETAAFSLWFLGGLVLPAADWSHSPEYTGCSGSSWLFRMCSQIIGDHRFYACLFREYRWWLAESELRTIPHLPRGLDRGSCGFGGRKKGWPFIGWVLVFSALGSL